MDSHPEGLVRLLVHQGVLLNGLSEAVQHHLRPAQGLRIGAGVEHRVPGGRPDDVRRGARDPVFEYFPGARVQKTEFVEAPPHRVGREGQNLVVGGDLESAHREIAFGGVAVRLARQLIAVQQEFLPARRAALRSGRAAAEHRVLLPAAVA